MRIIIPLGKDNVQDKDDASIEKRGIMDIISLYDKVNEKTREYIKDIIRLESDRIQTIHMNMDEFLSSYDKIKHAPINLEVHVKKEEYDNNEWCRIACNLIYILDPNATIILEESQGNVDL